MKPDLNEKWDDLLVKYLLGEASPNEQQAVNEWRAQRPDNEMYYQQLNAVWEKSRVIAAKTTVSEDEAWGRFRQKITGAASGTATSQTGDTPASGAFRIGVTDINDKLLKGNDEGSRSNDTGNNEDGNAASHVTKPGGDNVKRIGFALRWWQVAAALLVLLAGAWLVIRVVQFQSSVTIASGNAVLTDTLPDGSIITLNKNAAIVYKGSFNNKHRNVSLRGEAFFDVASDKNKPFTITTENDIAITVLGTSFNVRNTETITEIIVESGMIEVTLGDKSVRVKAHEKLTVDSKEMKLQKQSNSSVLYNHYRTHTFVCQSTPLSELVAKLNEVYGADIVVTNSKLAGLPLTTTFNEASLDSIIHIVCLTLDIRSRKEQNRIILE